jgi:hypothetical protein
MCSLIWSCLRFSFFIFRHCCWLQDLPLYRVGLLAVQPCGHQGKWWWDLLTFSCYSFDSRGDDNSNGLHYYLQARAAPLNTMPCGMRTTWAPVRCRPSPTTSATWKSSCSLPPPSSQTMDHHSLLNFHSAALHCVSSSTLYSPGGHLRTRLCMEVDSGEHMRWSPVGVVDVLQHSCRY